MDATNPMGRHLDFAGFPAVGDLFVLPAPSESRTGPHWPREFARKLYAYEALEPTAGAGKEEPEPFSLQWFLDIESRRHTKRARWIPKLMEFAKHSGETLLGLGHGLGTDWVQYARHDAQVVVCSPSATQLELVRRNFDLRGLQGRFIYAHPCSLPLQPSSIDVVCLSSLLHGIDDPLKVVQEVYRVLKPGGKVLTVTPARFDVDFWFESIFFLTRWLPGRRNRPRPRPEERYTGVGLRKLFARFVNHRIYKRQLRRSEVPHIWRWLPLPLLARLMGRVLVLKAFKPLRCTDG